MATHALLAAIPDAYVHATRADLAHADGSPIDLDVARRQHAAYAQALGDAGLSVRVLLADETSADSPFVEDVALMLRGRAVILRSAHPGRVGEAGRVASALSAAGLEGVTLPAGTCDGGDVLRVGDTLYVGTSARTDPTGQRALSQLVAPWGLTVRPVPLPVGTLHLKCVCTSPAPGVVVLAEGTVEATVFGNARVVLVPAAEAYAANVVGIGDRVLVAAGFPHTARALAAEGLVVVPLETSEFRRGDGSLTCLSLRW